MPEGAISHFELPAFEWQSLRVRPPQEAADALQGILKSLDAIEDQVFAARGMACLLIEERQLYQQFIDPEVDQPYASFDRWIKTVLPKSWGYCRDALRTMKELRDMPVTDLLEIKRCNLETLKKVSTHIRKEPQVIEAAKTQTEAQFAQTLTKDFHQHIEGKKTLKLTYDAGEYAEVLKFLGWVGSHLPEPTEDPGQSLLAWAIDWNIEHSEDEAA